MQKYFESVKQLPLCYNLLKHQMLGKGADPLGVKKVSIKMINFHALQFEKMQF